MQELRDAINQGNWFQILRWWNEGNARGGLLFTLEELGVRESGEISIPEWLTNDSMIIPLLGLIAQENSGRTAHLKEIRLQAHHENFPESLAALDTLQLLQVEQMETAELNGIEHVRTHTLVLNVEQLERNLYKLSQIIGLEVLIVCKGGQNSYLTAERVIQTFPNLKELYSKLPLGNIENLPSRLLYCSFDGGFLYFREEEGRYNERLLQAKISSLPTERFPNLEYLEMQRMDFSPVVASYFPKVKVFETNISPNYIKDWFWEMESDITQMKVGSLIMELKGGYGPISHRIKRVKGGLPNCKAPSLKEVYIPRGKVRFDGNFIERYPALERILCQSATYQPSFWYGNLPLKGIEEKGNYPRTFIFSPYGGVLGDRLERLHCNYRWLVKEIQHMPSLRALCVYQSKNIMPIVHNLVELEELYVESLPFGREDEFLLPEQDLHFERIVEPYQFAWRDRLAVGGFGFLYVHRTLEEEKWERWSQGQMVRFEKIEHIENFAYCWSNGYRAARFVDKITYDDEFMKVVEKTDVEDLNWEWLYDFKISSGYFSWMIELRHRNGRSKDVNEVDIFAQKREEYFRELMEAGDSRLRGLSSFRNLPISEDEVLALL